MTSTTRESAERVFSNLDDFTAGLVAALVDIARSSTDVSISAEIEKLRPFALNEQSYLYTKALLRQLALQRSCSGVATGRLVDRISSELDELVGRTS
jgi:hypothetical protein